MSYVCLIFLLSHVHAIQEPASQRWEKTIAAFEESDRKSPPSPGSTLFIGSSSIRLWDLKKSFPDLEAINRGFGGSQVSDSVAFVDRIVIPYVPKLIVLYAGDNDVAAGKTPETVTGDFQKFVTLVHEKLPDTHIFYIAIKPSLARWKLFSKMAEANQRIKLMADQNKMVTYVDIVSPMLNRDGKPHQDLFLEDGLHLNAKGYALWNQVLWPLLEKQNPKRR